MTKVLEKTLTSFTILLFSVSLFGCKDGKNDKAAGRQGRPNMMAAEGYVTSAQSFVNNITASGSLVPNEEIEIRPEISGRITAILFKEGSRVKKGQTLVELYSADIAAQVRKLKAQRDLQVKTLERQKQLLDIGGISRQEYESYLKFHNQRQGIESYNNAAITAWALEQKRDTIRRNIIKIP